jgi:hypothetical protein
MVAVAILLSMVFCLVGCLAMLGGVNSTQYAASLPCVRTNSGTEVAAIIDATLSPTASAPTGSEQPRAAASSAVADSDWREGLTVKGAAMTADQAAIAVQIASVVASRYEILGPYKQRVTVIALMTGIVESGLLNLPYGDADSAGVFQQRPSQGWGTYEEIMDVVYATNAFVDALLALPDWTTGDYSELAQAVQKSGYPDRYALYQTEAEAIYVRSAGLPLIQTADNCPSPDSESRLGQVVLAALAAVGDPYSWPVSEEKVFDGAGFVKEVFKAAGIDLPATLKDLAVYQGDDAAGISAEFISKDKIVSGEIPLKPADIPLFSKSGETQPADADSAGVYVGTSNLGKVRIATYNVQGASHTSKDPNDRDSWQNRIEKVYRLIVANHFTVVGLQELEPVQRKRLVELLGDDWGISPAKATYGDSPAVDARNSIVWDKRQVEAVEESDLDMPLYFDKNRKQIPLVKFQLVRSPDQQFYVANTHDPAHPEYAAERLANASQHAADADKLVAEGLPVFFTGDFNSGYALRSEGNITAGNDRDNLTWCVMTVSGSMVDGYDASRPEPRLGYCPQATSDELGVNPVDHIFESVGLPGTSWHQIKGRSVTGSDHSVVYIDAGSDEPEDGNGLGSYVGPRPSDGVIVFRPVPTDKLVGVIRLTILPAGLDQPLVISGDWTLPIPKSQYTLTAGFGECGQLWQSCHTGQDFAAPTGTQVYAATGGEIVSAGLAGAYGNRIIIRQPDGTETWYCHLSAYDVTSGSVEVGTPIAKVGATGNTTGPHLHFEVHPGGGAAVDPMPILQAHGLNP